MSVDPSNVVSKYFDYKNFNVSKGLINKETSENKVFAVAQKIANTVAAAFVFVGELFMNALRIIANGGIAVRNLFNREVEDVTSSSSSSSAVEMTQSTPQPSAPVADQQPQQQAPAPVGDQSQPPAVDQQQKAPAEDVLVQSTPPSQAGLTEEETRAAQQAREEQELNENAAQVKIPHRPGVMEQVTTVAKSAFKNAFNFISFPVRHPFQFVYEGTFAIHSPIRFLKTTYQEGLIPIGNAILAGRDAVLSQFEKRAHGKDMVSKEATAV